MKGGIMKKMSFRKIALVCTSLLAATVSNSFSEDVIAENKPVIDMRFDVKVSPETVTLSQSLPDKDAVKITLTIVNNEKKTAVFNKFYDCWNPVLVSKAKEMVKLSYARDATRAPNSEDFPKIARGMSKSAEASFTFFEKNGISHICIWDTTGGAFSGPITVGEYSLCIDYLSKKDEWITEVSKGRFGFAFKDLFEGEKRSNWVKVIVRK